MLELMNMAPGKTQQILPINFVEEFNISMETTGGYASWINESNKNTIELLITWLGQALLTVINMKKNGDVHQRH